MTLDVDKSHVLRYMHHEAGAIKLNTPGANGPSRLIACTVQLVPGHWEGQNKCEE